MKEIILAVSFALILFVCITGCGQVSSEKELDKVENLIAYLDGANEILFVKPEFKDTVLAILNDGDILKDLLSNFNVIETGSPYTFTLFDDSLWIDTTRYYYPDYTYLKLYINADCNKVHPGFTSDCMGTFGRHRFWGNSMLWKVNTWKSCSAGSNICIETLERIGHISYYSDSNCMSLDTLVITRGIYEWACAN
jgi:hypothetical protein